MGQDEWTVRASVRGSKLERWLVVFPEPGVWCEIMGLLVMVGILAITMGVGS